MVTALGPRTQAVVLLLLVATVGALAGITGDRMIAAQRVATTPPDTTPAASAVVPDTAPADTVQAPPVAPVPSPPVASDEPPADIIERLPGMAPRGQRGQGQQGARYVEQLARVLELTSEQQAALDSIVTEERMRIRALNREMQPRFMQIVRQTQMRVNEVLTPEQRRQLRMMRQDRLRALDERRTPPRPERRPEPPPRP